MWLEDGNDLRGHHFREMVGRPQVAFPTTILILAAGVAAALTLGLLGVAIVAVLAIAAGLVLLEVADRRATGDFFESYARARGWELGGRSELPQATLLLCRGARRYATRTLRGDLADDVAGTLALYCFEEDTAVQGSSATQTTRSRFTLALTAVPECEALVPELYCQRRFGPARPSACRTPYASRDRDDRRAASRRGDWVALPRLGSPWRPKTRKRG